MDRKALINAINTAVDQYALLNSSAVNLELPTETAEKVGLHNVSPPVIDALAKEPMFQDSTRLMIRSENASSTLNRNIIAPKLVKKAISTGSAEIAIDWLEKILSIEKAVGFSIMALWGMTIHESVSLGHGISLMPITSLPDSSQKRWLTADERIFSGLDSINMSMIEAPTTALVVETLVDPVIYDATKSQPPSNASPFNSLELLNDARLALTVIGPSAPIQACYWFHFKDPDIEEAQLGAGRSSQHIEIMPMNIESFGEFDNQVASVIVDKYLSMHDNTRKRIKIALERLNQGLRRARPGDRAMEISIALETLLADGGTENTFKIGLRAALLLGGDITTKLENRAMVNGAYIMRSALVHSGEVLPKTKVPNLGKLPSDNIARRAAIICADVIKKIINCGHIPEWNKFELLQVNKIEP